MSNLNMFGSNVPPAPPVPISSGAVGGNTGWGYIENEKEKKEKERIKRIREDDEFIKLFLEAVTNILNNQ